MKQQQRRQKNKERDKNKQPKESKKERQEGRKKKKNERERERERETEQEKLKKGEAQKRLSRNKGRHSKINKKPFYRGENRFFLLEAKKGKEKKKQTKKEGLRPSEVTLQATSPGNLAKKARNRGFSKAFFEKQICVTKRPFLDNKEPNPEIPVIIFLPFSSLSSTKNTKISWNPNFHSVLANLKR